MTSNDFECNWEIRSEWDWCDCPMAAQLVTDEPRSFHLCCNKQVSKYSERTPNRQEASRTVSTHKQACKYTFPSSMPTHS